MILFKACLSSVAILVCISDGGRALHFGTALEHQFGACGCSLSPPAPGVSLQFVPPCLGSAHVGPGHWSNSLLSKANSLGNRIWNQYCIFVINLWSVCVLIRGAERSMSYKEDSTNCTSESSVLGWQREVLLSEHFKRADFHFCKSWCFKNLCQTIQSTKNYSLEEKSEYYDV